MLNMYTGMRCHVVIAHNGAYINVYDCGVDEMRRLIRRYGGLEVKSLGKYYLKEFDKEREAIYRMPRAVITDGAKEESKFFTMIRTRMEDRRDDKIRK